MSCNTIMEVSKGNNIFPPNPYYIPGYGGYVPQFTFKFGDTYGRTTHDLLTDPNIRKSPRSLLAPLDNKEKLLEFHYHTEHPGYVTHQPILCPPEVPLCPQPLLEEPLVAQMEPGHWLPPEPLPGLALHPEAQEMEGEVAKPPLARALGVGTGRCQCHCGGSTTLETGGVALPGGVATADYPLPVLPVPNAIRQKVILGYTGYIPCSMDNVGMTYLLSVKKAMQEFDRRQLLERNPPYTLGTRFPLTHWPDTKIYSRAGLIPNYAGFVPHLQDISGLTYGDGTRESYRCEQRRRGRAL
uniref:Ciliary microtubule inner protein 2A-C-like domain-containing protein n=1 Tax=Taeniopygia guttata TaxID=59729 RepID=A0A674GKI2_TAEGU|nr:protein FAM166A isoform X2 [Taeniopygia guttata]